MFDPGSIKVCFEIFSRITKELTEKLDVSEVLENITRQTAEATGSKGCAVRVLNEKTRLFELSAVWGLSEEYIKKGPIDADHSLSDDLKGEIVHIEDAATDPRVQYPEAAKSEGIVSMLSVPMAVSDKVIGVLRLYTSERRSYSEDELAFVTALADLGVLVLRHAHLYSGLKGDHDSLIENFQTWFEADVYKPH
jgi:signal transduction protein with GAF and PtsI domain